MYVATFWTNDKWHEWDWHVLRWLSESRPPEFSPRVVVLDLKAYDFSNPQYDRSVIARFLQQLGARHQKPAAVLLDFFFEAQASKQPDRATADLSRSLDGAAHDALDVYATVSEPNMLAAPLGGIDWSKIGELDWPNVYDRLSGGAGHTVLNDYDDGLFYQACYPQVNKPDAEGHVAGRFDVHALPYLAVTAGEERSTSHCDPTVMKIVRLGSHEDFTNAHLDEISLDHPFPAKIDNLDRKYVIVATVAKDLGPVTGRSNPELLAWAISDLLANPEVAYYEPVPYGDMLIVLVVVFTLLTLAMFVATFLWLRRWSLGAARIHLPWIAALVSGLLTLLFFGGFEALLLWMKHIQPQVSLIGLAIVVTAGLSGARARQILHEQSSTIDVPPEEAHDHDVFISYAHDELAWVRENVYLPLNGARLPDGRKLKIFFDTSSIRVGTAWQEAISLSIDGSRFIVPVYSERYFERPYCRYEIRRAHRKWVAEGSGSRCVLPIMRGHPTIDRSVDDIQAVSLDDDPDLIAEIVNEVVSRLSGK